MAERQIRRRSGLADVQNENLLDRVYHLRGVSREARDLSLERLLSPADLPDIEKASARVERAIRDDERILIVGDFDADGATSVALAVKLLRAFGGKQVDFIVPNRFDFGYGLSPELVVLAAERRPNLIITVDNGVSSHAGVDAAKARGIDVIITDHHLPGPELPQALAVVNPVLEGSAFASSSLAGVGVIYYLLAMVRRRLQQSGWFADIGRAIPNMAEYLDLVAVGTVADVVPLDHNNRILVQQGLRRLRAGRGRPGLNALIEVGKRELRRLTASDIAFAVGPRLNAAGRLEDMTVGIQCLLADDEGEARRLAVALDQLNLVRRELEQTMVADAEMIVAQASAADETRVGVCLYEESWHQGVVGIVAGRMKEKLHRPVIAFADEDAHFVKGSARSVEGLHVRDLLADIATSYPGLIVKFGGHAMAAGLTLKRQHFNHFAKIFDKRAKALLSEEALQAVCLTDGGLRDDEFSLEWADELAAGGPWGQACPEPMFDGEFECVSARVVGGQHLKMTLRLPGGTGPALIDAIAFRQGARLPEARGRLHLAYRLARNDYQSVPTLQLIVELLAPVATT